MQWERDEHGTWRPATRIVETPEQEQMRRRAEAEHGEDIAVRLDASYKLEYYNKTTGQVVSCHY